MAFVWEAQSKKNKTGAPRWSGSEKDHTHVVDPRRSSALRSDGQESAPLHETPRQEELGPRVVPFYRLFFAGDSVPLLK